MEKDSVIYLRPHHFLCTLSFQGKGYSEAFVQNYSSIVVQLNSNENTLIEVKKSLDNVCFPCPHKRNNNRCKYQKRVSNLDVKHLEILGFQYGQKFTWPEVKQHIKNRLTLADFHYACEGCSWKKLGICEDAISKFLSK